MRRFKHGEPIVLGLAGEALTGKTVTADRLSPPAKVDVDGPVDWSSMAFATPLYAMATIRQKTQGEQVLDRMLYGIHEILVDLFGGSPLYGAPAYDELVEMAYEIVEATCEPDGMKARTFMQIVGTDICRKYDPDCFVRYLQRRVRVDYHRWESEEQDFYGAVIGDLRFENEAKMIHEHPNGVLVKFIADIDVRRARSRKRDGKELTASQHAHSSETGINSIPSSWFDAIIDTSYISVDEQVQRVKDLVYSFIGGFQFAENQS
ncbi:MAG TPA: hypothetical protein VJ742_11940 [Nitrososphaera sp.]|nr:hypothetical protein [Nitrososphaera sp.]